MDFQATNHYEPLKLDRAGAGGHTPRRATAVRQWLSKHRLLFGLVLMGVLAALAAALGYGIVVREGTLIEGTLGEPSYM